MKITANLVIDGQPLQFSASRDTPEAMNEINDFINQQFHAGLNAAAALQKRIDSVNLVVEY